MTDKEIIDKCHWISNGIKWNYPETYSRIIDWCKDKLDGYPYIQKCYWYYHGITEFPSCKHCGKPNKKKIDKNGYACSKQYCCYDCVIRSRTQEDIDIITQKRSQTCLDKYGYNNPLKVPEIHDKQKKTCLDKFGTEYFGTTQEHTIKTKKTCLERFGKESFIQVKENCESITRKWQETVHQKYGTDTTLKVKEVHDKAIQTCIDKYGHDNYAKTDAFKDLIAKNRYDSISSTVSIPLFTLEEYRKHGPDYVYSWKCKDCGNVFESDWKVVYSGYVPKCPLCYKQVCKSEKEIELRKFLEQQCSKIGIRLSSNNFNVRKVIAPLELDIYIPQLKIAFEFDGIFWHSTENIQDPYYHYQKTKMCNDLGIRLYHIFEDMWNIRSSQIMDHIKRILDVERKNIDSCTIRPIDINTYDKFNNENCIVFYPQKSNVYGLYSDNELIGSFVLQNNTIKNLCIKKGYSLSNYDWIDDNLIEFDTRLFQNFDGLDIVKQSEPRLMYSYSDRTSYVLNENVKHNLIYDCGTSTFQKHKRIK